MNTRVMTDQKRAVMLCICKVTSASLLRCNASLDTVVDLVDMKINDRTFSSFNTNLNYEGSVTNMKPITSMRIRVVRFLTNQYAYRERPDYLIELVAFGVMAITAIFVTA